MNKSFDFSACWQVFALLLPLSVLSAQRSNKVSLLRDYRFLCFYLRPFTAYCLLFTKADFSLVLTAYGLI